MAEFAALVGVAEQTIYRYLHGTRFPRRAIMLRIERASGGKVRPADWYGGCEAAE